MKTHILTEDVDRLFYLLMKTNQFVESKAMTIISIVTVFNDSDDEWVTTILYKD